MCVVCVCVQDECRDIAADTLAKCEDDFGPVTRLIIARPGRAGAPAGAEGRVYVEFAALEDAKKAAAGLDRVKCAIHTRAHTHAHARTRTRTRTRVRARAHTQHT